MQTLAVGADRFSTGTMISYVIYSHQSVIESRQDRLNALLALSNSSHGGDQILASISNAARELHNEMLTTNGVTAGLVAALGTIKAMQSGPEAQRRLLEVLRCLKANFRNQTSCS